MNQNKDQLKRLYRKGSDRIEKDLDIVNIIKSMRYLRHLKKSDPDKNFDIKISPQNAISIDNTDSSDSSESEKETRDDIPLNTLGIANQTINSETQIN